MEWPLEISGLEITVLSLLTFSSFQRMTRTFVLYITKPKKRKSRRVIVQHPADHPATDGIILQLQLAPMRWDRIRLGAAGPAAAAARAPGGGRGSRGSGRARRPPPARRASAAASLLRSSAHAGRAASPSRLPSHILLRRVAPRRWGGRRKACLVGRGRGGSGLLLRGWELGWIIT